MLDWFTDPPELPEPQGLQPGECADCGGNALVDARYEGVIRCSGCAARFHNVSTVAPVPLRSAPRSYVVKPWISQSERGALRSGTAQHDPAVSAPRWRVITPARVVTDVDPYPEQVRRFVADLPDDQSARVTYALAEDLKLGRLVESIAVRLPHVGYAIWQRSGDGSWSTLGAQIADPLLRSCSVTEFVALALGKEWTRPTPPAPPIKGPCPRCSTPGHPNVVRWKISKDGSRPADPYAHNRPARTKETKIKCLPSD